MSSVWSFHGACFQVGAVPTIAQRFSGAVVACSGIVVVIVGVVAVSVIVVSVIYSGPNKKPALAELTTTEVLVTRGAARAWSVPAFAPVTNMPPIHVAIGSVDPAAVMATQVS